MGISCVVRIVSLNIILRCCQTSKVLYEGIIIKKTFLKTMAIKLNTYAMDTLYIVAPHLISSFRVNYVK